MENLSLYGYFIKCGRSIDFGGRATRKEYWGFVLFRDVFLIIWAVFGVATAALSEEVLGFIGSGEEILRASKYIGLLCFAISMIPQIAVFSRRMHDIGRSGWWWCLNLILMIAFFVGIHSWLLFIFPFISFVWLCTDGDLFDNEYGPSPYLNNDD